MQQVPICENGARISEPLSSEGASTSLSLNMPRHGYSERAAFDLNSMEEDDRMVDVSSESGARTRPFPGAPTEQLSHGHGHSHHCSPLDLELGMSLSTPSIGT